MSAGGPEPAPADQGTATRVHRAAERTRQAAADEVVRRMPMAPTLAVESRQLALRGAIGIVVGGATAILLLLVDAAIGWSLPFQRDAVEQLLVALVGALLTIAVFAIWMRAIVVGLASSRVSPRLVTGYLDDRFQRSVAAWMIGGVTFVIVTALRLPRLEAGGQVPPLSVMTSMLLAVAGLLGILLAVRHATMTMSLPSLVRQLTDRALERIAVGDDRPDDQDPPSPGPDGALQVSTGHLGWIQGLDREAMLAALPAGAVARLQATTGDFVRASDVVVTLHGDVDERVVDRVRAAIEVERTRKSTSDLAFAIQELTDIGEHALGPPVDTSTALEVFLHLEAVLGTLIERGVPSGHLQGDEGRWIVSDVAWSVADHLAPPVARMRQASHDHASMSRELHGMLWRLLERARDHGDEDAQRVLLDQLRAAGHTVSEHTAGPGDRGGHRRTTTRPGGASRVDGSADGDDPFGA